MIVVMSPNSTKEQLDHVVQMVEEMGLSTHLIYGTNRTVVAAVGDKRMLDKGAVENAPGVEKIVPILSPYKVASREVKREDTAIELQPNRCKIGEKKIGIIAGPCSVEDRSQLLEIADAVHPVILVERSDRLGGWMAQLSRLYLNFDDSENLLAERIEAVTEFPIAMSGMKIDRLRLVEMLTAE